MREHSYQRVPRVRNALGDQEQSPRSPTSISDDSGGPSDFGFDLVLIGEVWPHLFVSQPLGAGCDTLGCLLRTCSASLPQCCCFASWFLPAW